MKSHEFLYWIWRRLFFLNIRIIVLRSTALVIDIFWHLDTRANISFHSFVNYILLMVLSFFYFPELYFLHWIGCLATLTHWGRVTHICVSELTIIGSDNGLSPGRHQAIIWNNAGLLLIEPLGTNFSEISIGVQTFSFKKMHLNMSSAKWRRFCLGLNVLRYEVCNYLFVIWTKVHNAFYIFPECLELIGVRWPTDWRVTLKFCNGLKLICLGYR